MTSPAFPPNRRRRRVVVTIAVLVLGLVWCFRPRVDQRFVGKWEMHFPSALSAVRSLPKTLLNRGACEYQFFANGWGRRVLQPPMMLTRSAASSHNFRWWVDDDVLVVEPNYFTGFRCLYAQAQTMVAPALGLRPELQRERWQLRAVSDKSLTMNAGVLRWMTLRRVPD
jgi:hypothetical protein